MSAVERISSALLLFPHHENIRDRAWHRLIRGTMCLWVLYVSLTFCLWMYGVYYITPDQARTKLDLANQRLGSVEWQHVSAPGALGGGVVVFLKSVELKFLGVRTAFTLDQARDPRTLLEVRGMPRAAVVLYLAGLTMVLLWVPSLAYRLLLAAVARLFYGASLPSMLKAL